MTALAGAAPSRGGTVTLAVIAALMWGLWWVPIRYLESAGFGGAWAGLAMNAGALPLLVILALTHRGADRLTLKALMGAVLVGVAITLYASALTFTDVVRAVLLFYLAPAWSTIIECVFLGRRWTWRSSLALGLSLLGALIIFRGDITLSGLNAGDMMALGSGMAWSVGAALIFTAPAASARRLAFATCLGAIAVGALVLVLGGPVAGTLAPRLEIATLAGLAVSSGMIYLAPIIVITMWSARRLPPALFSFLLTAEILSGVISSALFLDERFGWPEAIGATFVALGAVVEIITNPTKRAADLDGESRQLGGELR